MNEEEFNSLIDKEKYQVFILSSSLYYPFNFIRHNWIVTSKKGKITRYDIWEKKTTPAKETYGFVKIGIMRPWTGLAKNILTKFFKVEKKARYRSRLEGKIEGNKDSLAYIMCNFIEKEAKNYYFKDRYSTLGPNCNTFVQWFLDKFPEANIELRWFSLGKNYQRKKFT